MFDMFSEICVRMNEFEADSHRHRWLMYFTGFVKYSEKIIIFPALSLKLSN